ncbi:MAG: hypothetical protein AAGI30_02665 [Planctomycetota bacterium]
MHEHWMRHPSAPHASAQSGTPMSAHRDRRRLTRPTGTSRATGALDESVSGDPTRRRDALYRALFGVAAIRQTHVTTYRGEHRLVWRSGQGTAHHHALGVYSGGWALGRWSGEGRLALDTGVLIEGRFERGAAHGRCVLTTSAGVVYRGAFAAGLPHGSFVLTLPNAVRFEGDWHSALEAEGSATFCDGRSSKALFRDGRLSIPKGWFEKQIIWRALA